MRGKNTVRRTGKGSKEEDLPSRFARTQLTGGDLYQRSMNNYAKKAPGADDEFPNIFEMGQNTVKL